MFNCFRMIFYVFVMMYFSDLYADNAISELDSKIKQNGHNKVSIELKNSNIADAIRLLARFLQQNVVVSSAIHGTTSLHLQDADAEQALNVLLLSHGYAKWQIGNIWFVGLSEDLIKHQQEEAKWQNIKTETSPLLLRIWQLKYAKVEDILQILQDSRMPFISKRGKVSVDKRTNTLCVQDVKERMDALQKVINKLDVPVRQIAIAARLASVDSDYERELGIQFTTNSEEPIEVGKKHAIKLKPRLAEVGKYSIAVASLADASTLDVKLSALESNGHAELISSPSLFTASHQSASIEAGEEVPYQEVSESGGTAIVFKKAVLGLKVTPQALPGNKVLLQLQINQDRPSSKMILGMPTISTRQVATNVLVKSGQTIVLGGIYETNQEKVEQSVPFIGQLPIIGWLFKQQSSKNNKRELLIFVTPTIII